MIRSPGFWTYTGWESYLLSPLSGPVAAVTTLRISQVGWQAPVPVICCGNSTIGGAGKTTLVLDLACRLKARGIAVHVLLRGYRGAPKASRRVDQGDSVSITGDEALLLAEVAPTWTGANRAESARGAIAEGAEALLMDDGLQNPSLKKTLSVLVVDGATGFGNGNVLPAGPLRERVETAASRCRVAVMIGPDINGAAASLPPMLTVLCADLVQGDEIFDLRGRRVLAFTGIAIPNKFFTALERAGVKMVGRTVFADHHIFTSAELALLRESAKAQNAVLVTTPKDAVRLPAGVPVTVVGVRLVWRVETAIEALLDEVVCERLLNSPPDLSQHMG
jgi:tetraacyldisaccharide 4'-kinase